MRDVPLMQGFVLPEFRSVRERVVDVLLFLLSQTDNPSREDWISAVDDLFGELTESEKQRMADAGIAMLAAERRRPASTLKLVQGNRAGDRLNTRERVTKLSAVA